MSSGRMGIIRVVGFLFFLILIISSEVAAARSLNLARKNVAIHGDESSLSSVGFTSPRTGNPNKPICDRPGRYSDCIGKKQPPPCNDPYKRNCGPPQSKPQN